MKEYKKDDLDFIVRIAKDEIGTHHPEQNFLETDIEKRLKKNKTWIIYYQNRRAGFVSYRRTSFQLYPLSIKKRLFVDLVGFEKRYQHRGMGRQLMSWLQQEANKKKIQSIYGYVIRNNYQAVKVWEHFGCKVIGKMKDHLIMEKKVTFPAKK